MIKTRFSPSPTGMLHLGNARAALFSALLAKKENGIFLLRIEDTDLVRSEQKYAEMLQEDLHWLGIVWQEGPEVGGSHQPYFQSQRHAIYEQYYHALEKQGLAYPCFCSEQTLTLNRKLQLSRGQAPRYPGTCRKLSEADIQKKLEEGQKPALRFHVPNGIPIDFVDFVKGSQHFKSDDIGDFIIRRAEGTASFMFCNAIDDSLMGVTHVMRGEDHLANTPRQLLILSALKLRAPQYGHLSLITSGDGAKLSKREGSSSVHDLPLEGYLSIAVINYLSRLSHTYEENRLMTFDELASHFNIEKLSRASARFDHNQLLHWQKEAVLKLSIDETKKWLGSDIMQLVPAEYQDTFADLMQKNISFPDEAMKWANIFFADLTFNAEQEAVFAEVPADFFAEAAKLIEANNDIKNVCDTLKDKFNVSGKKLFMPIRVALTGEAFGPELAAIANLLGQKKMAERFNLARNMTK